MCVCGVCVNFANQANRLIIHVEYKGVCVCMCDGNFANQGNRLIFHDG